MNWLEKIPDCYFYVPKELTKALCEKLELKPKELQEKIKEEGHSFVPEEFKRVRLQGFREVARIRGIESAELISDHCSPDYVSKTSRIVWRENEYGSQEISTDCGESFPKDEPPPFHKYPACLAANRAFARNVRAFLNIMVMADVEFDGDSLLKDNTDNAEESSFEPQAVLAKKAKKLGFTFEQIRARVKEKGLSEEADDWSDFADMPKDLSLRVSGMLNEKKEKDAMPKKKRAVKKTPAKKRGRGRPPKNRQGQLYL